MKHLARIVSLVALSLPFASSAALAEEGSFTPNRVKINTDGDLHVGFTDTLCKADNGVNKTWGWVDAADPRLPHMLSVALAAQLSGRNLYIQLDPVSASCQILSIEVR